MLTIRFVAGPVIDSNIKWLMEVEKVHIRASKRESSLVKNWHDDKKFIMLILQSAIRLFHKADNRRLGQL